jgi:hypothetical protein
MIQKKTFCFNIHSIKSVFEKNEKFFYDSKGSRISQKVKKGEILRTAAQITHSASLIGTSSMLKFMLI